MSIALDTVWTRAVTAAAPTDPTDPTDPKNFPPGAVKLPRTGIRTTMQVLGGLVGGVGIAGAAAALITGLGKGPLVRPNMGALLGLGAAAILGGAVFGGSFAVGPRTEHALAAGIPTEDLAHSVEMRVPGDTEVVKTDDGTYAVLRRVVLHTGGGGGARSSNDDDDDRPSRPRPSTPSGGGYQPAPSSPSPSYPSSPGGDTSPGDSGGGSHSSSGNSTSNGNPSEDDF
jgi:hypothetical protein